MMKFFGYVRRAFVTQGNDPTEIVSWTNKEAGFAIEEFQNCYTVQVNGQVTEDRATHELGAALHRSLEAQYDADMAANEELEATSADGWGWV